MQKLWSILAAILRFLGLQNVIIIEAEKAIRENTEGVFREMMRRGWDKRYRFVLISLHPETLDAWNRKHITILPRPDASEGGLKRLKYRWYRLRAAMIVDENYQIRKSVPSTVRIYLTHGSTIKSLRAYCNVKPGTDYMLNQSEFWKPVNAYEFNIDEKKLVTLGYPRNDALFTHTVDMAALFGRSYQKVVTWYPTYRQFNKENYNRPYHGDTTIPLIQDAVFAEKLNEIAARYDVLLVIKPHPAQDVSKIREMQLSHLRYISDEFYIEHNTSTYRFLADTDALITDYSSVLFDYLLTDKPVGLAFEDFEQYRDQVGFAIDMDIVRACGPELATPEDFEAFFRDLVSGNDPYRESRERIKHLTNQYTDGNSARRVVDWLETLLPQHKGK